jgi:hypothetical protein
VVDRFGDRGTAVAHQVADVFDPDAAVVTGDRHEAMAQLPGGPVRPEPGRLGDLLELTADLPAGPRATRTRQVAIRSADPLHEQQVDLPLLLQDELHHASRAAEGECPHRPVRLLLAVRATRPGGNLQQRLRLGVGGQGLGGQRGELRLHLVVVDNAVHLHAQAGKPFLELR